MTTHHVDISASSAEEAAVTTEPREEAAAAGSLLPIGGGPVEESASERDRARAVGGDALARLEAKGDRARATAQGRKPERSRWIPSDSSECEAESSAAQHADQAPRSQPRDPSAVGDKKITLRVADLTELLSKQLPSPRLNSKAVGISVVV